VAKSQEGIVISWPASGDLSSHRYKFVKQTSTGIALAGDGERFIGILQNKPAALGEEAAVMIAGLSKVKQAGTLTVGASIAPDASGLASAASAGDDGSCTLMENGGGANAIGSCVLHTGCQA